MNEQIFAKHFVLCLGKNVEICELNNNIMQYSCYQFKEYIQIMLSNGCFSTWMGIYIHGFNLSPILFHSLYTLKK